MMKIIKLLHFYFQTSKISSSSFSLFDFLKLSSLLTQVERSFSINTSQVTYPAWKLHQFLIYLSSSFDTHLILIHFFECLSLIKICSKISSHDRLIISRLKVYFLYHHLDIQFIISKCLQSVNSSDSKILSYDMHLAINIVLVKQLQENPKLWKIQWHWLWIICWPFIQAVWFNCYHLGVFQRNINSRQTIKEILSSSKNIELSLW